MVIKIASTLVANLTESTLRDYAESRVGNLARSLKELCRNEKFSKLIPFEKVASQIYLEKVRKRLASKVKPSGAEDYEMGESAEDGYVISKENIAIREVLTDLKIKFAEEEVLEGALHTADFYIPSAKLTIEINGVNHFYPYSTRFNNFSNLKNKLIRNNGQNVLNLNSWKLEGMLKDPARAGLKDLITKTVATYEGNGTRQ